jgi:penicillin-binding protein 1A
MEDRRFFEHRGLDARAVARAALTNLSEGQIHQGGSTLTQQLVKMQMLGPERTLWRKTQEAFLALWVEAQLSKQEILALYLDRAYMGAGVMGFEAAAQTFFGKPLSAVNLGEAAMLAGLLKAPSKDHPHHNSQAALERQQLVLRTMAQAGVIEAGAAHEAKQTPLQFARLEPRKADGHFLDLAYRSVLDIHRAGLLGEHKQLVVRTTLARPLQDQLAHTLHTTLQTEGQAADAREAAGLILSHDGGVRALVGGRDYEASAFNRAVHAKRQPGSAFKPFVFTAALLSGLDPRSVILDEPYGVQDWSPQNYNRQHLGAVTLTGALARSLNVPAVRLGEIVGRQNVADVARTMGVTTLKPTLTSSQGLLGYGPTLALGAVEVSLLDLTRAYGVFARGGLLLEPAVVEDIRGLDGALLWARSKGVRHERYAAHRGDKRHRSPCRCGGA